MMMKKPDTNYVCYYGFIECYIAKGYNTTCSESTKFDY